MNNQNDLWIFNSEFLYTESKKARFSILQGWILLVIVSIVGVIINWAFIDILGKYLALFWVITGFLFVLFPTFLSLIILIFERLRILYLKQQILSKIQDFLEKRTEFTQNPNKLSLQFVLEKLKILSSTNTEFIKKQILKKQQFYGWLEEQIQKIYHDFDQMVRKEIEEILNDNQTTPVEKLKTFSTTELFYVIKSFNSLNLIKDFTRWCIHSIIENKNLKDSEIKNHLKQLEAINKRVLRLSNVYLDREILLLDYSPIIENALLDLSKKYIHAHISEISAHSSLSNDILQRYVPMVINRKLTNFQYNPDKLTVTFHTDLDDSLKSLDAQFNQWGDRTKKKPF